MAARLRFFPQLVADKIGNRKARTGSPGEGEAAASGLSIEASTRLALSGLAIRGRDMKATWNGATLAESDNTVVVEGNHYFPPESVNKKYFQSSSTHTTCPWKGEASYHNVMVDGQVNKDAAWFYPEPKAAAAEIKDHVAFWRGVKVEDK
jgi:uncharacterized protein (DUF427 family)